MTTTRTILAAGTVVWRRRPGSRSGVEVLLVHRPRYQDWTFPKGKLDPGEPAAVAAVRETVEETGAAVRLGVPLPDVTYRVTAGVKVVSYWTARLRGDATSAFTPNREVDRIVWARPRDAARLLTYAHDRTLLDAFRDLRDADALRTRTVIVQRHAKAVAREDFDGPDHLRPLSAAGHRQAAALTGVLGAFGVRRVVSSPALRCVETVAPFGLDVVPEPRLAEGADRRQVAHAVAEAATSARSVVVCSHRPTLPDVFDALSLDPVPLAPGQGVVVHLRHGRVVATERIG